MSGRGFRGGSRGPYRGGPPRGGPTRGRGGQKRPYPPNRDFDSPGPPSKSLRGGHFSSSSTWNRGSEYREYDQPQSDFNHPGPSSYGGGNYQQPMQQTARQHRDNNYPPQALGPSYGGPSGPHGSRSLPTQSSLPKPIPARRDNATPPPPMRYRDEPHHLTSHPDPYMDPRSRHRSPQVRMLPQQQQQQYPSHNDYYRSPPPPSPPPALMDNPGPSYATNMPRGRRSPSRGRVMSPASVRGRGRGVATKKPSALERLGPKLSLSDRLGPRGRGSGRGGRGRGALLPTPSKASLAFESKVNSVEENNKRYVEEIGGGVKIECQHCGFKAAAWEKYTSHLIGEMHAGSLKAVRTRLQQKIGILRASQRKTQNSLTKRMEEDGSLFDESGMRKATLFCKLCKLLFNQSRESHNESEDHKKIVLFLNPLCEICDIRFRTPMSYEKHLCSEKHLKNILNPPTKKKEKPDEDDDNEEEEEEMDFNPDDFVTLDEIVEEEDDKESEETSHAEESDKPIDEANSSMVCEGEKVRVESTETDNDSKLKTEGESNEASSKVREEAIEQEEEENKGVVLVEPDTPVGLDYVRQVVMFYCDLCHKYLPKLNRGDPDELVDSHCSSPGHQDAYVKKETEKRAEEKEALNALVKEELAVPSKTAKVDKIVFNEDQLDYEAESESVNGDIKSEASEK